MRVFRFLFLFLLYFLMTLGYLFYSVQFSRCNFALPRFTRRCYFIMSLIGLSSFFSWFFWWWRWGDSNSWPPACKAGALPTELHPHSMVVLLFSFFFFLCCFDSTGLDCFEVVGSSGLEPPTSRLSGVRSNQLSYEPICFYTGSLLLSQAVSRQVPSAVCGLTCVFEMGTGVPHRRIATSKFFVFGFYLEHSTV